MDRDRTGYKILVIEDNPGDLLLIEDFLEEKMLGPDISHADCLSTAKEILGNVDEKFDVLLLDLTLPDAEREELITSVVEMSGGAPVLALTGYTDFDFSVKSLSMGISDYLLKDELNATSLYKSIVYGIERKKTIAKLKASEKRYSDLFHLSPQPMWVYDLHTLKFLDVNKAAVDQYGYSRSEFLEMKITEIRPEGEVDNLLQSVNRVREGKPNTVYEGVFKHRKKSGEVIQAEIRSNVIVFRGKKSEIVLANDVTEREQHIEEIEKQNKQLKEIAWVQSHVVRAPLARMLGLIDMLDELTASGMSRRELLDLIVKSGRELDEVIRDITDKAQVLHSQSDEK